jgi:arylsulfatase A
MEKPPNIILMMSDDMGYECLSCNGALSYQTPHLDELAKNGIRFTNAYSQPLCTPSRVKIMTGRYNSENYIDFAYLDVKEQTFGNLLQKAGYKTTIAGKWQLNGVETKEPGCTDLNRPSHFGFDEYCLWWLCEKGSRFANPKIVQDGVMIETTIDDYGPDIVSDYIIDFIERNQDEPFFVYYPMMLVHSPFQPTPDSPEWQDVKTRTQNNNKYFKDMVEYSDKIVGKITAKLKQLDLLGNTILIFTGDNGTNKDLVTQTVNGAYPGGKGHLRDNGTHVPLVIHWPAGGQQNVVTSSLVEFSDFLPTFAEAAKVEIPANIDGRSFYSLLNNQIYHGRKSVFVHYQPYPQKVSDRSGCFVRTSEYKLYSDGRFFDMNADKWERKPLDITTLNSEERVVYEMLKSELATKTVWDFSVPHRVLK